MMNSIEWRKKELKRKCKENRCKNLKTSLIFTFYLIPFIEMVVKRLCFVLILLFQFVWGQNIDNSYVLEENRKALNLNREGKFVEANAILHSLLLKLQEENSKENLFAVTYQTKAKIVQSLGNYEESNLLARKSLQISLKLFDSVKIADNFNTIGINHYFQSDYDSTTFYYEKSLEIKRKIKTNPYGLAVSTYNLALVYDDLGQTERALELYNQSETLLLESKQKKNFLSDVYVGMALIHFYSGDLSKAEIYVEKALEKGLSSYGEFNPNMTFVYTTYANILEAKKEYEAAIDLLKKNLKIRRESYGEWHRWTCETNYDLANSYVLVKNYDKAEEHYLKAIEIGNRINSRQYLANARNFLGQLYLDRLIHLDEAQNLLHFALETNREIYGDISDLVAENYLQLAKLYKTKGQHKEFLEYIDECLKAANYKADRPNELIGPLQAIGAMMLLTDYYSDEFKRNGNIETLKNSYKQVDKKIELIKLAQSNFSSDRSRIDFANKYREVFEKDLGICWLLYHETRDPKYLQKAFELSETNRNTALLKGLHGI
jgi:tetratricopeptide (TPR) repeat protein